MKDSIIVNVSCYKMFHVFSIGSHKRKTFCHSNCAIFLVDVVTAFSNINNSMKSGTFYDIVYGTALTLLKLMLFAEK